MPRETARVYGRSLTPIGVLGAGLLVMGLALGGVDYPEIGAELPGFQRDNFSEALKCALQTLPPPYKDQLEHCCEHVDDIAIHRLSTGMIPHWQNGGMVDAPEVDAWTPHAPPGDIEDCKSLCMAVSVGLMKTAESASIPGYVYAPDYLAILKNRMLHEAVHWLQYDTWSLWQLTNEQIYNLPYQGGDYVGRNGNPDPDLEEDDDGYDDHAADEQARELMDKFDQARSYYIETEAELGGEMRWGCNTARGGVFFDPDKAPKGTPAGKDYAESRLCLLMDCKDELFEKAEAAKNAPDTPSNMKLRALGEKIMADKEAMCEDIEALKKAKEKAEEKWNA